MLLAALGIHGVVSYGVAQRTREFGIRMALGSTPGQLKRQVVLSGLTTALIGLGLGMAGAAALASALRTLLYGVAPLDPGRPWLVSATSCFSSWRSSRTTYQPAGQRASIPWTPCTKSSRRIRVGRLRKPAA